MTRRKPYPRVTVSGAAANELLALANHWGMTPEEVVLRLVEQARVGRTATTAVNVGAAILGAVFSPPKELPAETQVVPSSMRLPR